MNELNTIEEAAVVLQGMVDGKVIQMLGDGFIWRNRSASHREKMPHFASTKYRVKPEPRRVWINKYETGLSDKVHHSKESAKEQTVLGGKSIEFIEVIK